MKATIDDRDKEMKDMNRNSYEAVTSDISFKCADCDYTATTGTVLKCRMAMKHRSSDHLSKVSCEHCNCEANSHIALENQFTTNHKPELPARERERNEDLNDSLEHSLST